LLGDVAAQDSLHGGVLEVDGAVQGRETIGHHVLVVHICPTSQKKLNAGEMSFGGGNHQGRVAADISLVDLGLGSQQQLHDLYVSKLGGTAQGRSALVVATSTAALATNRATTASLFPRWTAMLSGVHP
jgi:hypothetical protein